MKTTILLDKFYRYGNPLDKNYENYLSKALIQLIKDKVKDFDVDLKYIEMHKPGNRPVLAVAGKDEKYIVNYLKKEYGTIYHFSELEKGMTIRGRMRDPDLVNFGVFVDCGIENPSKDLLLPHFALVKQLMNGNRTPKKEICKAFGFHEEMPIYVTITKIDEGKKTVECKLADETLEMFNSWVEDGFELLLSVGIPRKRVKKAIKKSKHYPDYVTIERAGFLETLIFLKKGTHAPGILSEIGPMLSNVKFSMFRPSNVRHLRQKYVQTRTI